MIFYWKNQSVTREINSCGTLFYLQKNRKKGGNMRKERKRLDFADRKRIEAMKNSGVKVTEIAQAVGVHRATIYHELKRGGEPYRAEVAQRTL